MLHTGIKIGELNRLRFDNNIERLPTGGIEILIDAKSVYKKRRLRIIESRTDQILDAYIKSRQPTGKLFTVEVRQLQKDMMLLGPSRGIAIRAVARDFALDIRGESGE